MRPSRGFYTLFWIFLTGGVVGCGSSQSVSSATGGCDAGTAQIGVGEGSLAVLCGCQEAAGSVVTPPSTLTCTVAAGTSIFFNYQGIALNHQIISSGQPSFDSGGLSLPSKAGSVRTTVVKFSVAGAYSFLDSQEGVLSGQIVVR